MSKRLRDNISSGYVEAANRLNSRKSRRRIVAYVESYDDVFFWRTVLANYENDSRYFEVMLPSRKKLERGKKSVLMNLLSEKAGNDMICCVDADYDYLIKGATETSLRMMQSPFVFHTYAYSIENLQCYAPSLHNVCVAATLNDKRIFDFEEFFSQYSESIFHLFVWSIWHYRRPIYGNFTITEFNKVIEIGKFSLNNPMQCIQNVRRKAYNKVGWLQKKYPDAKESYLALKKELMEEMGVTPATTYLYIQGHHLFDKVAVPVLDKVCSQLIQEREKEIRCQSVHSTQLRNELASYNHSLQDIPQMLKKNAGYFMSEPFKWIQEDIKTYLDGQQSQTLQK
ncbi:MAG: DUF4435 domain-containing protein [Prevotellaceae bacterium]|nr:DUF4435 domain-containing protein [Prevotella sp.]MDD7258496.1 DUF4435 domain-containing protein [Prevotellaceae bacterium]MDY6130251.1 DUF4435 domain-containing protein [Prevotella sp.]